MIKLDGKIKLDEEAIKSPNLCDKFSDADLVAIGLKISEGYDIDVQSRLPWFRRTEAAMNLALQVVKEKSFPWPGSSNVVFPLVTIAAIQFHSRAYPAIIQNGEVVKCKMGPYAAPQDLEKGYRIGRYMSYQVLEEDQAWEEQHDRLLINIPIVGCAFKKSYFDAKVNHNVSELVLARDFVINYWAKDVHTARRKTHRIPLYRNDIWERCAAGVYRDVREETWFQQAAPTMPRAEDQDKDKRLGQNPPTTGGPDDAAPFWCLEQHVWLDLDGDGYEEPYVILVEESSQTTLRIVSRVERHEDITRDVRGRVVSILAAEYFTKYGFIPSPDGGIYDIGFGLLLGPLNESVNTLINQLIDAGTMAITAGGFLGRGAKFRGGTYSFSPFEWKRVDSSGEDLSKSLVPLPVREPSDVLFKLLSLLIDYTNRINGATEVLAGENPGQNTKTGTADMMVEQGLKIYAAIFKRIWRSMKEEFKKLYVLNAIHLPATRNSQAGVQVMREDFLGDPNRIVPVADPNVVSDRVRVAQATALTQRSMQVAGYNKQAVELNWLRAMQIDAPESFYVGEDKTGPLPNPKMMVEQAKTAREQMKLKQGAQLFAFDMAETHALNEAKIAELEAMATKLLAEAKGVDVSQQINAINAMVGAMKSHNDTLHQRAKVILDSLELEHGTSQDPGRSGASAAIQRVVGAPNDSAAGPPVGG